MRAWRASSGLGVLSWVGMACVYSAALWLLGLFLSAFGGWPEGAVAMALRMAGTLALGVGLCALERWAWATAVCLAGLYAVVSVGWAATAGWAWLSARPGTLSWMPVFLGLNLESCARLSVLAVAAALVSGGLCYLLWRAQPEYDVPYRRPYTVLFQDGAPRALLLVAIDAFLGAAWWAAAAVGG
ncbi:MAG: hypothetical protein ACK47B_04740 [Armatimonadota bacterium]